MAALVFVLLLNGAAWAAVPSEISIEGQLASSDGAPLTGERAYRVRFFDAETDGVQLGADVAGTAVVSSRGLFTIALTPPAEALAAATLYYELAIDTDDPADADATDDVFPTRVRVYAAPYALRAAQAEQVSADAVGSGVVDDAELATLDGATANIQTQLDAKADAATTYSMTEVDTALADKADAADTYTKAETDTALADKADAADTYTKAETDTALADKADAADTYTKAETDTALADKADAVHAHNLQDLDGAVTDAQVPDDITITEADTLDSVTSRGATTSNNVTVGALTATGAETTLGGAAAHTVKRPDAAAGAGAALTIQGQSTTEIDQDGGDIVLTPGQGGGGTGAPGGIMITDHAAAPSDPAGRLYNNGGTLFWNGAALGSSTFDGLTVNTDGYITFNEANALASTTDKLYRQGTSLYYNGNTLLDAGNLGGLQGVTDLGATTTNGITVDTVDTGQGAAEVYPMDQAVQTTDDVTFNSVTAATGTFGTGTVTVNDNITVSSGGKVGIGTETPTGFLEVMAPSGVAIEHADAGNTTDYSWSGTAWQSFTAEENYDLTGVAIYHTSTDTDTRDVRIFEGAGLGGTLLSTTTDVAFAGEGWTQGTLASPVTLTAGQTYTFAIGTASDFHLNIRISEYDSYTGGVGGDDGYTYNSRDFWFRIYADYGVTMSAGATGLGIGTTSPSEKLDVEGVLRLRDTTDAPNVTTGRLYNNAGNLFWNGVQLDGGSSTPTLDAVTSQGATTSNEVEVGSLTLPQTSLGDTTNKLWNSTLGGTLFWGNDQVLTASSSINVNKDDINNANTLGFDWSNDEVADDLTISSAGTVDGGALTAGSVTTAALASTLAFTGQALLDLSSVDANSPSTGLVLPQSTEVSNAGTEGQLSWDSDDDKLYVGIGGAVKEIGGSSGGGTRVSVIQFQSDGGSTISAATLFQYKMPYSGRIVSVQTYCFAVSSSPSVDVTLNGISALNSTPSFLTQSVVEASVRSDGNEEFNAGETLLIKTTSSGTDIYNYSVNVTVEFD
jgi:hypothetical protein